MVFFKILLTKVDFPLPEMPVTHVKQPNGKDAFIFLRLLSVAFFTVIHPESKESDNSSLLGGFILFFGTSILTFIERYFPVREVSEFMISFGVPSAINSPPLGPAPGPRSKI